MTILCPVDFSATALAATKLALNIAAKHGYRVHLIHAYAPFRSAFQGDMVNAADQNRALQEAQMGMNTFLKTLEGHENGVALTTDLSDRDLVNAINQYAPQMQAALVVMGTKGAKGAAGLLTGSNAYQIAKDSDVPLLIVPESAVFTESGRSIFFTDYQADDAITLNTLKHILGDEAAARCTLVHITPNEQPDDVTSEGDKLLKWKRQLEDATGIKGLGARVVPDKEHIDTVNEVLKAAEADLALLTIVGGRSFFERLTKKSLAKAIILNPTTPILLAKQNNWSG